MTSTVTVLKQVISNKPFTFQMYNCVCPKHEGVWRSEDPTPHILSTSTRLGEQ